jgi:predicted TIM-barrel fold metal-dependent hydrolase
MGEIRVIDAHVHMGLRNFPPDCQRLRDSSSPIMEQSFSDNSVEIEKVLLVPSFPCGNDTCEDGFWQQVEQYRDDHRFAQLGTVNPRCSNVKEILERQYSKGIVGIKLHPVHHGYSPNAYREEEGGMRGLGQVYEFAEEYKLPVLIHTGTSVGERARNKYGDPLLVDDPVKDFKVTFVLAHAGRPLWCDSAYFLARSYDNVYLELSSIPPESLRSYLPRLDSILNKCIYGSDFPSYKGQTLLNHAARFWNQVKDRGVMKENAVKVYGL